MFKKTVLDRRGHPVYLSSYPAITFRSFGFGARGPQRFYVPLNLHPKEIDANVHFHLEDQKDTACDNEPSPFLQGKSDSLVEADLVENLPKTAFQDAANMAKEEPPLKFANLAKKRDNYELLPTDEHCAETSNSDARCVEMADDDNAFEIPTKRRRRKVKFRLI